MVSRYIIALIIILFGAIAGIGLYDVGFKKGTERTSSCFINLIKYDPIHLSEVVGNIYPCNLTEKEKENVENFYEKLSTYECVLDNNKNDNLRKFLNHKIYKK